VLWSENSGICASFQDILNTVCMHHSIGQHVSIILSTVGTCESFFCVLIESAVRFDFESNFRIESAVYTTQAVTPSNELQGAPCRRTVYLPRTRVMHATEYLLFISIQSYNASNYAVVRLFNS